MLIDWQKAVVHPASDYGGSVHDLSPTIRKT